jgi:hypothetical protein
MVKMQFSEKSIKQGIDMALGSQGIWTPELASLILEEIIEHQLKESIIIDGQEIKISFGITTLKSNQNE